MVDKAKATQGVVKLLITPGAASPSPPVGPALGQRGINIMDFCNAFNARTQGMDKSIKVVVRIDVKENRKFDFVIKTPPTSLLILRELGKEKGSTQPLTQKIGSLSLAQLEKIAKIKQPDLTATDLKGAMRTVAGTARNMGVEVERGS